LITAVTDPHTLTILSPVAVRPLRVGVELEPVRLRRPLAGVTFGLEVDYAWECYRQVVDEWSQLLVRDGATPKTLWLEASRNETTKKSPEQIRDDVDQWSRLVECGVVGLGN
jgi:hypothetical protein